MKYNTVKFGIAFCLLAAGAQGAVSLQFSAVSGATNGVLTGLASSTGVTNAARVWGILVDTNSNGVSLGNYEFGASLAGGSANTLSTFIGGVSTTTDDVLYISPALMANSISATLDGGTLASGNLARPTTFTNIPTPNGSVNDQFYIVWFDEVALGGATALGGNYGAFRLDEFIIPADGATVNFNQLFVGADPVRLANFEFQGVPEPSAALLGALGALGLLRRRRI